MKTEDSEFLEEIYENYTRKQLLKLLNEAYQEKDRLRARIHDLERTIIALAKTIRRYEEVLEDED
ncbi:MAG: hypothetical protein DRP01_00905 [Archaeoglobales archaeon]|nr:MAG: hypothetical protein DRP01_00905 [Archaeoglobales archaeon]